MPSKLHPGILLISQADAPLALAHELLEDFYTKLDAREFTNPHNPNLQKAIGGVYNALHAWRIFLVEQYTKQLEPHERDPLGLSPWPNPETLAVLKARLADPEDPLPYLSDAHIHSSLLLKVLVQAFLRLQSLDNPPGPEATIMPATHAFAHQVKNWRDAMRTYKDGLHLDASLPEPSSHKGSA